MAELFLGLASEKVIDTHPQTILFANRAGVYSPVDPDVPPINDRGLLTTVGRTNGVPNSSATGAAAGTPGTAPSGWNVVTTLNGISREVIGLSTERGLPVVSIRFFGTSSANFALSIDAMAPTAKASASIGETWASSIFAAVTDNGGAPASFGIGLVERNSSDSAIGILNTSIVVTGDLERYVHIQTLGAEGVVGVTHYFRANITNGQSYDFTVHIAAPQLELGSFATDPIITSGSAATRTGNRPRLEGLPDGGRAFVLDMDLLAPAAAGYLQMLLCYSDGTSSNRMVLSLSSAGGLAFQSISSGGTASSPSGMPSVSSGRGVFYGVFHPTHRQVGLAGAGDSGVATDENTPTGINQCAFGGTGASAGANAYMLSRRFAEYRLNPGDDPADAFAMVKATAQEWAA